MKDKNFPIGVGPEPDDAFFIAGSTTPGPRTEYALELQGDGRVNLASQDIRRQGVTAVNNPGFPPIETGNDMAQVRPYMGAPEMPALKAAKRPSTAFEALSRCRADHPFVEIIEFPRVSPNVLCVSPSQAYDIDLLSETQAVRLVGNGQFWVSVNGAASAGGEDCQLVNFDTGNYWFVAGVNRVSVLATSANTYVSAHCLIRR